MRPEHRQRRVLVVRVAYPPGRRVAWLSELKHELQREDHELSCQSGKVGIPRQSWKILQSWGLY